MNKAELITTMAAKADLTKEQSTAALAALQSVITEELKNGEKVAMRSLCFTPLSADGGASFFAWMI